MVSTTQGLGKVIYICNLLVSPKGWSAWNDIVVINVVKDLAGHAGAKHFGEFSIADFRLTVGIKTSKMFQQWTL